MRPFLCHCRCFYGCEVTKVDLASSQLGKLLEEISAVRGPVFTLLPLQCSKCYFNSYSKHCFSASQPMNNECTAVSSPTWGVSSLVSFSSQIIRNRQKCDCGCVFWGRNRRKLFSGGLPVSNSLFLNSSGQFKLVTEGAEGNMLSRCVLLLDVLLETDSCNSFKVLSYVIGFSKFQTIGILKINSQDTENSAQQQQQSAASNCNINSFHMAC